MQRDANNEGSPKTLYWLIMAMVVMCAIAMMSGCKTQERVVTVIEHRTDTVRENHIQRDSVWVWCHDSIVTKERSDTVLVEKWHWRDRWRDRLKTDTVYVANSDTVTSTATVTKEVAKPLTWWQKTQMYAGDVLLICLFVAAGFGIFKVLKKFGVV